MSIDEAFEKLPEPEGWTWLHNSPKWHYFREGRSLCRKWLILGPQDFEPEEKLESPDNCKACVKVRRKELRRD